GASSTGKTTLARQLSAVLPNCTVVHQDNPNECVIHPLFNEPYLDDPPTAINWPLFRKRVQQLRYCSSRIKTERNLSPLFKLNRDGSRQDFGKLPDNMVAVWRQRFYELDEEWRSQGVKLKWCIIEGWHLYYDPEVVEELDIRLLIRSPSNVLRNRKENRAYKQKDGSLRVDPPYYWDHFSYPAYVRSHSHLFEGEMETGPLSAEAESAGIILLKGKALRAIFLVATCFSTQLLRLFSRENPSWRENGSSKQCLDEVVYVVSSGLVLSVQLQGNAVYEHVNFNFSLWCMYMRWMNRLVQMTSLL
ncbi:hypothetical protein B0J17DRAFT_577559, partial [Rhizoctonia solani]